MIVRTAKETDLKGIVKIAEDGYQEEERVSENVYLNRIRLFSDYFYILEDDRNIVSFISTIRISSKEINDDIYSDLRFYDPNGKYLYILGVNTNKEYQSRGCASFLLKEVIKDSKHNGIENIILSCKKELIPFYEKNGFKVLGLANSNLNNEEWYLMSL